MDAVRAVAEPSDPQGMGNGDDGYFYRRKMQMRRLLPPQMGGKCYWSLVDHSLPFLQVCLHPEVLAVGRQVMPLVGEPSDDFYMRNAGVNDMGPGFSIAWHHDGSYAIEFMHYFSGSSTANGCLRVVPGSVSARHSACLSATPHS